MPDKRGDNVILFPSVAERNLKKAREAREQFEYDEALQHLSAILRIEPNHPAALLMMAETLYEAKRYEEAEEAAKRMWEERIGNTSQVLRLYLSCLLQTEDFTRVNQVIEEVLEGEELHDIIQELTEIKKACEMLEFPEEEQDKEVPVSRLSVLRKVEEDPGYAARLYEKLDNGTFDEQLSSIEQMKYIHTPETVAVLREYIMLVYPDPILKTFAIRALKELGESGPVLIHKFGQIFETNIEEIPFQDKEIPEGERKVVEIITGIAYQQDTSFLPFAFQLWMEYLFSIYPLHPEVQNPSGWAAALHYAASKLLHIKQSKQEIAELYQVGLSSLNQNYRNLNEVLEIESRLL
ncbi:tetratricopeptide repeat protein [Aneurinibacillus tyrosinisolvens]|uniref:tetratricopeptide repeat protein n=1 Tax=Aneurinibacillus tyrosinisolvens TaxID=1443435 RepID=UPI00063EF2F3|nr:tetratricopeptide repeat protein [Aneurinibacillus tyrosinisolvens]